MISLSLGEVLHGWNGDPGDYSLYNGIKADKMKRGADGYKHLGLSAHG